MGILDEGFMLAVGGNLESRGVIGARFNDHGIEMSLMPQVNEDVP